MEGEELTLLLVRVIMSGISLVACLLMLATLCGFRKYQTVAGRLVMVLTSMVGASASVNLLTPLVHLNAGLCIFQGVAMQFADSASGVWTVIIAVNVFLIVVANYRETDKFEVWYHVVGWPIAVVFTVLPATTTSYGETAIWCWIRSDATLGNVWRFACFYVPLFVCLLAIAALYLLIFLRLSHTFAELPGSAKSAKVVENERRMLRSLAAYPLIFLFVWLCPTINRIYGWASGDDEVFGLLLVQSFTVGSQGLLNSLAYGLDSHTRRRRRKQRPGRQLSHFRQRRTVRASKASTAYVLLSDDDDEVSDGDDAATAYTTITTDELSSSTTSSSTYSSSTSSARSEP
ncbi:slime mold cyclic amp receptor protein [Acanthamoeba castellanii str. Neff]|uniref:Slime mold cyclic amp receptor protein n=1 Tax=Acanthamoeba castellanii (strain ATCC 30010 / Neff) TaxID=1257118 RepID=L8H1T1_ACACF|nr:slime mold cyclic amp receptor protein [Acanthamoeba castellanii str. Neff]ELR19162.1 slime mold cyclic amp receptor protein [Acanthamoeba castellanii str. Neff]